MAEKTINELLRTDFRWPQIGDRAFTKSPRWEENAHIDPFGHDRLVIMMTGYRRAADLLVAQCFNDPLDRDSLVFPIVFNYRQFVELSLKFLISSYGFTVGIDANWKSHDLQSLWRTFARVLDGYGVADLDGSTAISAGLVAEFAMVDPGSFSFRYPVDTNGKLVALPYTELDVRSLRDVMAGLKGFFSGCDGYLCDLQQAGP